MIVISRALTISPVDDEPLSHPVIGWHNLVTSANLVADSEQEAYPASNLANHSTNLLWKGTSESPAAIEHLRVNLSGHLEPVDYLAVARHNFGTAQVTCGVEYQDEEGEWQPLVEEIIPADDAPLIFRFDPQTLSAIRLTLEGGTEPPEAAVLFVGKLLVFQRGMQGDYTPLPFAREANIVSGVSEAGDYLGRIITSSTARSSALFRTLTPAWVREHLDPFLEASADQPFFFAWSPEAYPYEVGFAWLENNAQPVFDLDGYSSVELSMTGILA